MWRGRPRPYDGKKLSQPFLYFYHRKPRHPNHFPAAALAGRYGNGRTRNLQKICKEFDTGFIGPPINGRCCYRELQRITNFTGDRVLPGARMDFHGEGYASRCFMNRNQLELEVSTIRRSPRAVIGAGGG
jgi:hypothetical protein